MKKIIQFVKSHNLLKSCTSLSVLFLSVPVPLVDFLPLDSQSVRKAVTFFSCPVRIFEKFLLEEANLVEFEAIMMNFLFCGALLTHD